MIVLFDPNQLDENWKILLMSETSMIKWLEDNLYNKQRIGYDPWLMRANEILNLKDKLICKGIIFEAQDVNLIDLIWTDRPSIRQGGAIKWPNKFFGLEDLLIASSFVTFPLSTSDVKHCSNVIIP